MTTIPPLSNEQPVALTIAGSDSGGGAGIQADIKTFTALDVFGTSAITCITAQNPDGVSGIESVSAEMISSQIQAVAEGFPVAAVKTGMLYSAEIIAAVADSQKKHHFPVLVVDPVMVATSGASLLREDAIRALRDLLAPLATILTPNMPEAGVLLGRAVETEDDQALAARELSDIFGTAVVVKGGHGQGNESVDVLVWKRIEHRQRLPRIKVTQTHGTGCVFSAAITAFLALGRPLLEAVFEAKGFVARALARAPTTGKYRPLAFLKAAAE